MAYGKITAWRRSGSCKRKMRNILSLLQNNGMKIALLKYTKTLEKKSTWGQEILFYDLSFSTDQRLINLLIKTFLNNMCVCVCVCVCDCKSWKLLRMNFVFSFSNTQTHYILIYIYTLLIKILIAFLMFDIFAAP